MDLNATGFGMTTMVGHGERRRRRCKLANGRMAPVQSAGRSREGGGGDTELGDRIGRNSAFSAQSNGAGEATTSVCVAATAREREGVQDGMALACYARACNCSEQSFHPTSKPQTRSLGGYSLGARSDLGPLRASRTGWLLYIAPDPEINTTLRNGLCHKSN